MSSKVSSTPKKALPSFAELLLGAGRLYQRNLSVLFGYAGWLLLPFAAHVIVRITFGGSATGNLLDAVSNMIFAVLTIGIYNIIALSVPGLQALHADKNATIDTSALAERAQQLILPVFFVILLSSLATLASLIAFVVPAIIVSTWFAFAGLTTLFENTRGVSSLVRSKELVRGRFWPVLGRLWGAQLVLLLIYCVVAAILALALGYQALGTDLLAPLPLPADIVLSVFEIMLLPFVVVYNTLLYLALKNE